MAAVLSVAVLGASAGPGFFGGSYDPELAILTLTVVGLIWYTAFTYEGVEGARRSALSRERREREALATALLAEMEGHFHTARALYEDHEHATLTTPMSASPTAIEHAHLFTPDTVAALILVKNAESNVRAIMEATRGGSPISDRLIRGHAWYLASHVAPLITRLQEIEGGSLTPTPILEFGPEDELPPLPPDPFGVKAE